MKNESPLAESFTDLLTILLIAQQGETTTQKIERRLNHLHVRKVQRYVKILVDQGYLKRQENYKIQVTNKLFEAVVTNGAVFKKVAA